MCGAQKILTSLPLSLAIGPLPSGQQSSSPLPLAIGRLPLTKTDVALAVFVPAVSDLAIAALAVFARALAAVELANQIC